MNKYKLEKLPNGKILLCKIINEYSNIEDAEKDLIKLVTKKITEEDIKK